MLGRASDRAKGAPAPHAAGTSTAKADLGKQLFPSSSPSSSQQRDITSWATSAKKPYSTSTVRGPFARASAPLRPRSSNPQSLSSTRAVLATPAGVGMLRANSVVSICSSAGSFEGPLFSSESQSRGSTISSVLVNEDDFSDDNTLELDYECPGSLPPLPPTKTNSISAAQPASATSTTDTADQLPTSEISWSSSAPQHMFPPDKPQQLKREPANDPLPPAKKRVLPSSFRTNPPEPTSSGLHDPDPNPDPSATPLSKQRDLLWDATQSAIKEGRKQLKIQSKKSGSDAHLSPEETRTATDSHGIKKTKASAISLSSEQQHVIDLVIKNSQSVFFTGPAGTGKSVLMRAIIAELRKKWARDPERLSVTASTGLAACNIGGQTLHSFAGIGLGKEDVPTLVKKIRRNAKAKNRWLRTKVLIIDEVSMVDGDLFDKLSEIARTIRKNGRPFGGIQLVITGDFFQLPPVPENGKKEAKFAFDAATWNTVIDHTIGLTQVFRQKDPG